MTTEVTRAEFDALKGRVDVLEGDVDGEKTVTRYVLEQTRRNGDDLAAIKGRLDRLERSFEGLEQKFDSLRNDLPGIVGDVVREALRRKD